MAIVKMKKLHLMAMRSMREEIIRELGQLGCVEVSSQTGILKDNELAALVRPETSDLSKLRAEHSAVIHAVEIIRKYAVIRAGSSPAKSDKSGEGLWGEKGLEDVFAQAAELDHLDKSIKRRTKEISRMNSMLAALKPWGTLDVPLDIHGTKVTAFLLGSVASCTDMEAVNRAVLKITDEAQVSIVSGSSGLIHISIIVMKSAQAAVLEELRGFGFSVVKFPGMRGTAGENIEELRARIREISEEKEQDIAAVAEKAGDIYLLKAAADKLDEEIGRAEVTERLLSTDRVFMLEGWMPAEQTEKLQPIIDKYDCEIELSDPPGEEPEDVPVLLKNNAFTRPLAVVTGISGLPSYTGIDPNPFMAPFFILFFGMMMGDMAYGLFMLIGGLIAFKIKRGEDGKNLAQLLLYCGISALLWGAAAGSLFGDTPYRVAKILNPDTEFRGLPGLFTPINDTAAVLLGSGILGAVHMMTGMIISFCKKIRDGKVSDALLDEGAVWLFIASVVMACFGFALWLPLTGLVALLMAQGRTGIGIGGKTGNALIGAYGIVVGLLADLLSYSRLTVLMLAGNAVGFVFNNIAAVSNNIFVYLIVCIIGHALNFALIFTGCYGHSLRLQYVEFFGKFYEGGGRPFDPLKIETDNVNIIK